MKKLLLLTASSALITTSVFAQPRKGDWIAGLNIFPQSIKGGYFLTDKLTINTAVNVNFGQNLSVANSNVYLGLSPSIRYYICKKGIEANKFQFFADLNFTVSGGLTYDAVSKWRSHRYDIGSGIGPGVQYMITNRVSAEAMTRINHRGWSTPSQNHSLSTTLEMGIQVYLKGRKKQSDVAEMRGS